MDQNGDAVRNKLPNPELTDSPGAKQLSAGNTLSYPGIHCIKPEVVGCGCLGTSLGYTTHSI